MTRQHKISLSGMQQQAPTGLPGWETTWTVFGPITTKNDATKWPRKIGFNRLPLDGARSIPAQAVIHGRTYRARLARSHRGCLDFLKLFKSASDRQIVYMMTEIQATHPALLPISFGANRGTQWWLNGKLVYATRQIDFLDSDDRTSHQFEAPLRKGKNLLVIRIIGCHTGCSITLSGLPFIKSSGHQRRLNKEQPKSLVSGTIRKDKRTLTRDYCETGLRVEERPNPLVSRETRRRYEKAMAAHGIQARWIGIVDDTGSPYARSQFLPRRPGNNLEYERRLKLQVQTIHKLGMTAMTWFPGSYCLSAAKAHPAWRTVFLEQKNHTEAVKRNVCINSPFGQALIGFVIESIKKLDLDGFWFDGTLWTHPGNIGCVCAYCRKQFQHDEGIDLPKKADWNNVVFRRWVAWRYRSYIGFWGRLTAEVRRSCPRARIAVNHAHRFPYWSFPGPGPIESWLSAIPIDCYDADIIAGTEATDSPFVSAFHSRQQRAYGRPYAETWLGLHFLYCTHKNWPKESNPLNHHLHHAMACMTAGVMPSFGTPDPGDKPTAAYDALGALVNPVRPYVGGRGEPYAALHLSQQSETFFFSRRSDWGFPWPYWRSVLGWHNLLCENQFLADIAFDGHLTPSQLNHWPVFIAPLSIALSDQHIRLFEEYVASGGILVAGPYFGACDEWGNRANPRRVAKLLGRQADSIPDPNGSTRQTSSVNIHRLGSGASIIMAGDVGNRFYDNHSAILSREVGALIRRHAPPRVSVKGPRRLHVGLYRDQGHLRLFIHNFMAYSECLRFPNPKYMPPEPATNIVVKLRGYDIRSAQLVFPAGRHQIRTRQQGDMFRLFIPRIERGVVIEMRT